MRLLGGKDYYDSVIPFAEQDYVFVRGNFKKAPYRTKQDEYRLKEQYELELDTKKAKNVSGERFGAEIVYLIFCGKLYRGISVTKIKDQSLTTAYMWKESAIRAALEEIGGSLPTKDSHFRWRESRLITESNLSSFLGPVYVGDALFDLMYDQAIVHSIGIRNSMAGRSDPKIKWYDNTDGLKNVNFASVIDPWQTYQEIEMWVGSQLAREENRMVSLSDQEMIAKHGFDKVSFRNTHHAGKPRKGS